MTRRGPLVFDTMHVINLDRRPERMKRFVNRVRNEQDWDVPIVRHSAVDTATWTTRTAERETSLRSYVDPSQIEVIERGFRTAEPQLSRGAVGCTLSHMALWTYLAAHRDLEYLAVFEDDAVWSLGTHLSRDAVVDLLRTNVPDTWDIMSLGAQHVEVGRDCGYYSELKRFWATHAYFVHRDAVGKLLRNMLPIRCQLDAAISEKTLTEGLRVFSLNRVMYWQQSPDTDVQVPLHLPDGTVRNVDGTFTDPDGTRRLADGTPVA